MKRMNTSSLVALREGFTLIEILVVVAIIGVLTGLIAMRTSGRIDDTRIVTTTAKVQTIKAAIAEYEMDNGKIPSSLKDLVQDGKHYLDQEDVPRDGWDNEFKFYMKGDLLKVRSAGPDGQFDTIDDIVNK